MRERTAPAWEPAPQKRIAVAGLSRCSGATTVAAGLALFFAEQGKRTSFTECGVPPRMNSLLYEACGMEERFSSREFTDCYGKLVRSEPIREISNLEQGVNWILITPEDVSQNLVLDEGMKGRLLQAGQGNAAVYDMDLIQDPDWKDWAVDMDHLIAVCDPMPSRMMTNRETLQLLKSLERSMPGRFTWIINRVNPGISRRQVRGYLKSARIRELPDLPAEIAYGCEFRCRFLWEDSRYRSALEPIFRELCPDMLREPETVGKHDRR